MEFPRLASLRDIFSLSIPPQAIAMKTVAEKRRAIGFASELFASRARKRYATPFTIYVESEDFVVTSAAGTVTYAGSPTGHAADVKVEIVSGGLVSGGAVTVRVSKDDGLAGTWLPTQTLPTDGKLTIDGVELTFTGTFVALESVTYSPGPTPAIRGSVAAWAAWVLIGSRGAKAETLELLKTGYEDAKLFAKELGHGEEAELPSGADATPARPEMGVLFTRNTRDGFRYGRP